jgi:activator of 2-hydroxyglutaryl-CoA dehydratase/predicted nucleotide-binding protein (sugar kinase/HSP70/actin superfamily)
MPPGLGPAAGLPLVLGVDLGKVTTSLAVGEVGPGAEVRLLATRAERHLGDPLRPFFELYRSLDAGRLAGVVATGVYGERLGGPAVGGVPEEIAQEQAAAWLYPDGSVNIVRVGGGGYSVLARDAAGNVRYEANERCSAGTGETVEGLCGRLGRSLEDAVALAEATAEGVTVTSRCAVFAKSELTHFANQGEPHARIFRGLFEGVARNVHSLYVKSRTDGPVILVGHGALIGPIAAGVAALSEAPVEVAEHAGVFEALGAMRFAAARVQGPVEAGEGRTGFPVGPEVLVRPASSRIGRLEPASDGPGSVVRLGGAPAPQTWTGPLVLGLDLGSTGSKAALVDAASGAVLATVYRRTEGNPVEAAQALVAEVGEMAPDPVVAVGLTGSGRDAAASVFRAALPDLGERLVVQNEIVAHATAAAALDPDGGRSLSIVEIGGQDAKFINVENGRVVDADMNRVCSAGTGSFLEEQALAHGVEDIAEFGRLAARSDGPPDLGQTCTVFVADVAAEALGDGFSREDIFAGLQFSVVRNYRSRVMGQRRLLGRVFFQGKPATDPALARTLAAVLEREVVVPADPGAMGAVGIALLTARSAGLPGAAPADLTRVLEARVEGRREFQCGDRDCLNRCHLELAEIAVGGAVEKIVSGGQCPKYDAVSAAGQKLPRDAPNPYRERDALLRAQLEEDGTGAAARRAAGDPRGAAGIGLTVGLPYAHYLIDTLPFFHVLLRRLGHHVEVLRPGRDTLAEGDRRCAAPGACAPVKLLHGLAGAEVDVFFAPIFVHLPLPNAGAQTYTCPMAQGAPDMVGRALRAEGSSTRVLRPVLFEREGDGFEAPRVRRSVSRAMRELSDAAGGAALTPAMFDAAYAGALEAQRGFEAGLRGVGERSLAWARDHGYPVVLIAGETHVIHDAILDAGVHELVAANGALPLPVDCYPTPDDVPGLRRVHWASAGQALRATAAGAAAGDVYPLLLGAYGCGPNSMIEHLFADLTEDWPHAVLESDGHGGKAGYVTRVQALLHSVRRWRDAGAEVAGGHEAEEAAAARRARVPAAHPAARAGLQARLARLDRRLPHSLDAGYARYYFGHLGGGLSRHLAAAMRGAGYDASYVGEPDAAALRAAGAACSGKECLPYQLIWGSFARFLDEEAARPDGSRALFLSAGNGFQACRANLFPLTEQISLERLGLSDHVEVADFSLVTGNVRMMPIVWIALVAVDLLNMLRFHALADEAERGASDALFQEYSDRLEAMLEQPRPDAGAAGNVAGAIRFCAEVEALLGQAARAYAALPRDAVRTEDLRDVYLCGDLYLRVDEWGNDDLQRKLADHGLRVIFEPYGAFFELLQLRQIQDGLTLKKRPEKEATLRTMRFVIGRLTRAVRAEHPWVFWNEVREVDRESRRLVAPYPFGETIPAVGGALLTWRTQPVDGVVSVAPRGCGPALIAEAQLRREAGLPALFIYNDGDPIDEARLAGFAWRLRGRPARRAAVS